MSQAHPILRIFDCYLLSLTGELSDTEVENLQRRVLERLWNEPALGLVLDVTGLDIIDSYMARVFDDLGLATAAMGARTVLVGLKPAIAITLVEMGIELAHVMVALNVDAGLNLLRKHGSGVSKSGLSRRERALERVRAELSERRDELLAAMRSQNRGSSS